MIEHDLELRLKAALRNGLPRSVEVRGNWECAAAGVLKLLENSAAPAFAVVAVSPRAFETFGFGAATVNCTVALAIRNELDPEGKLMFAAAEWLTEQFTAWHLCRDESMHTALSVPGFSADGFTLSGGDGPTLDRERGIASLSFNFTLKGIFS